MIAPSFFIQSAQTRGLHFAANNMLMLNTGTLSFEDMVGTKSSTSQSTAFTISNKFSLGASSVGSAKKDDGASKDSTDTSSAWDQLMATQEAASKQWQTFKKDVVVSPGAFSYKGSESVQTARATVGEGTIIVRDNPDMDLSGLNRDTSQAMTTETTRSISFSLSPLFGHVDTALSVPGKIDSTLKFWNDPVGTFTGILNKIQDSWGFESDTAKNNNAGGATP